MHLVTWPLLALIDRLLSLEANWDSYGALPVKRSAARRAFLFLVQAAEHDFIQPAIVPTNRGGLQFEWHFPDYDFEVRASPDGSAIEFFEETSADTLEGRLEDDPGMFEAALTRLLERQRTLTG
jgi:hypothetical protein